MTSSFLLRLALLGFLFLPAAGCGAYREELDDLLGDPEDDLSFVEPAQAGDNEAG